MSVTVSSSVCFIHVSRKLFLQCISHYPETLLDGNTNSRRIINETLANHEPLVL